MKNNNRPNPFSLSPEAQRQLQSKELEEDFLSHCLHRPELVLRHSILTADAFSLPENAALWSFLTMKARECGGQWNARNLAFWLPEYPDEADRIGGIERVTALLEISVHADAEASVRQLQVMSERREALALLQVQAQRLLFSKRPTSFNNSGSLSITGGAIEALTPIQNSFKTPWDKLNDLLTLSRGATTVIGGRPGMAKTSVALQLADFLAEKYQEPVLFIALESSRRAMIRRLLSRRSKIPSNYLRDGRVYDEDWRSLSEALHGALSTPLFISDKGHSGLTDEDFNELKQQISLYRRQFGSFSSVFFDHVSLAAADDGKEVARISKNCSRLASEMDCHVFPLFQLNRGVESREDKRPMMSDLRQSGSVEQDAHNIILLYRDEYYNKESMIPGTIELIVAKQKEGPTGTVLCGFDARSTTIYNIDTYSN